jgi:predicted kinase
MSRVIFMCGPAGSGKSTIARRYEAGGMLRLSVDTEAWARGHRVVPLPSDVGAEIIAELQQRLLAAVTEGEDVVLDLSFWSRAMRDEWRSLLSATAAEPEIVHVVASRETVLSRLRTRAVAHSDDFRLPVGLAEAYFDHFEPPAPEEGPITVIRTD